MQLVRKCYNEGLEVAKKDKSGSLYVYITLLIAEALYILEHFDIVARTILMMVLIGYFISVVVFSYLRVLTAQNKELRRICSILNMFTMAIVFLFGFYTCKVECTVITLIAFATTIIIEIVRSVCRKHRNCAYVELLLSAIMILPYVMLITVFFTIGYISVIQKIVCVVGYFLLIPFVLYYEKHIMKENIFSLILFKE